MSISQTENTNIKFHPHTDELTSVIGPYSKKLRLSLTFDPDKDQTDQSQQKDCDINEIMARYQKTGLIDFVNQHQPQYADATGFDFHEMQDQIVHAKNMFADLPAKIRERFGNNPGNFVEFFNDPDNALEAAKMGLLAPEKAELLLNPPPPSPKAPEPSNPSGKPDDKKAD